MSISDRIRPWILLTETAARGSLASAAQSLGLTLPSASKQIRTLEKETGSVLLDRTKKPAVLTHAALRLLPAAQQAAHAWRTLQTCVSELGTEIPARERILRISIPANSAHGPLLSLVELFEASHPGIKIDVVCDCGVAGLLNGTADIA
ncbi:MAG: LysR family transcriptional regulator [Sutterella sp.]|nr:LysR family transcriptional regulator [Sutterella sp.]